MDIVEFNKTSKWINSPYNQVEFVLRAIGNDVTRQFLCMLHVEKQEGDFSYIVCTDGKRCHYAIIPSELIENGDYSVITNNSKNIILKKNEDSQSVFPHWKKVIPSMREEYKDKLIKSEKIFCIPKMNKSDMFKFTIEYARFIRETNAIIAIQYFSDINYDGNFEVFYQDNEKPVEFMNTVNKVFAVIMPMSIKE